MELATKLVRRPELDVALWLYTKTQPPQADWDAAIERIAFRFAPGAEQMLAHFRMVVITDGGAPNTMQRAQLGRLLRGVRHKVSVITPPAPSAVMRGIMTALAWINPSMVFFRPAQVREALQHTDLLPMASVLMAEFRALQAQMPQVKTLAQVESELRRIARRSQARPSLQ
ncbi:MAG: hypothetical protein ABW252_04810 [Polyangiales bacterium]